MSDLLRPDPPPDWRGRAAELRSRLRPARLAAGGVAVLAVALAAAWLLRAPAPPVEASLPLARPLATTVGGSTTTTLGPTSTIAGEVVVQVAGAVVQPGVYRLPNDARVADLITAAGGVTATADPGSVLLAAPVADGARVYVPEVGEAPPPSPAPPTAPDSGAGAAAATAPDASPLDLNAASDAELDDLPGVGPATAAAIVAHREQRGPFSSVDQLLDVRGIGPAKLEALRTLVRV